jgi:CRISPR-associated protein Cmr4
MIPTFYTITAQTNLHVGSGDANYGIIDKLVQRDALTQFPVIHASSLKGAILQHFFKVLESNSLNATGEPEITADDIAYAFGSQHEKRWKTNKPGRVETSTGNFIFMQANLLSIPIRCKEHIFMRVSSDRILKDLVTFSGLDNDVVEQLTKLIELAESGEIVLVSKSGDKPTTEVTLEDKQFTATKKEEFDSVKKLLGGDRVVILPEEKFKELVSDHYLPVIARNHLENGQSTNLWYEQILPRQTRFGFTILKPEKQDSVKDFDAILTKKGMVQIGANASVGYGYCTIENFPLQTEKNNENQSK